MINKVYHFELHSSSDIPKLLDDLEEKFRRKNLIATDIPVDMIANHKQLTLKNYTGTLVRIYGPGEIIEDLYLIYFSPSAREMFKQQNEIK